MRLTLGFCETLRGDMFFFLVFFFTSVFNIILLIIINAEQIFELFFFSSLHRKYSQLAALKHSRGYQLIISRNQCRRQIPLKKYCCFTLCCRCSAGKKYKVFCPLDVFHYFYFYKLNHGEYNLALKKRIYKKTQLFNVKMKTDFYKVIPLN